MKKIVVLFLFAIPLQCFGVQKKWAAALHCCGCGSKISQHVTMDKVAFGGNWERVCLLKHYSKQLKSAPEHIKQLPPGDKKTIEIAAQEERAWLKWESEKDTMQLLIVTVGMVLIFICDRWVFMQQQNIT